MSVEYRKRDRMPQPERWLSEHPVWTIGTLGVAIAIVGWWFA
jgi:hypothetical protein